MAEAGKEGEPKRCRCGFWGSPQTLNMCSKCYKDSLQKVQPSSQKTSTTTSGEASQLFKHLGLVPTASTAHSTANSNSNEDIQNTENQPDGAKPVDLDTENNVDPYLPVERPVQKNKKKCWICKTKLELAQRELGGCKCGYTFCFLHRLPEQHSCIYDHKEGGRAYDMKNMVPASKKKIGRSFHRMDSKPE